MDLNKEIDDLYINLAKISAQATWIRMGDPNGSTHIHNENARLIRHTRNKIKKLNLNEIDEFKLAHLLDDQERLIEQKFRPTKIVFNKNALHIQTKHSIPEDIQLALSLGNKFLFPYNISDKNLHDMLAQLEMSIEDSIPVIKWHEAFIDTANIIRQYEFTDKDNDKNWLKFIHHRTMTFFKSHKDKILCTRSDKGGHTVVMDTTDYDKKLAELLSDDAYTIVNDHNLLDTLIDKEKELTESILTKKKNNSFLNKTLKLAKLPAFEPLTLNFAKFYGVPKIHKNGCPLRPITSTVGSPGFHLSKILQTLIEHIFPPTNIHIRDTIQFIDFIKTTSVKDDDVLVSFDVISMFTTIPIEHVTQILMEKAGEFNFLFNIQPNDLREILKFLLRDCAIFQALNTTYKQIEGLPMGSCLSPVLARIFMDGTIEFLNNHINDITFIKVYVDDTIAAINKHKIQEALNILNSYKKDKVKFTVEEENDNLSINFLNVTLTRHRNTIWSNWYRKNYASGRLVNFYSSHKYSTTMATATNFIKTVLALSSPHFYESNRIKVIDTLRSNSFPEDAILFLMHDNYTYMKPTHKANTNKVNNLGHICFVKENEIHTQTSIKEDIEQNSDIKRYIIFPHSTCKSFHIKQALTRLMPEHCTLADSVKNTRLSPITTRKSQTPPERRTNALLFSQCHCKRLFKVTRTKFNENVELAKKKHSTQDLNECTHTKHVHHLDHIKTRKGLAYNRQTNHLKKYISWNYRHAIESTTNGPDFPNFHMSKLIKVCLCCKNTSSQS